MNSQSFGRILYKFVARSVRSV